MFDIGWKLPIEQFDDGEFIDDDAVPVVDDGDIDIFYEMNLGTHDSDVESTEESLVADEADALALDDDDGSEEITPIPPKRIVFSARESPPDLQNAGIKQLLDDTQDSTIKSDPIVFGFDTDYMYYHVYGASSRYHQSRVGSTKDGSVALPVRKRRTFKQVFNITEQRKAIPKKIAGLDLLQYTYKLRVSDKALWPRSNEKKVASTKSAYSMLTTRPVVDWCREDGIIPLVTHPLKNEQTIKVAVGPYLDPTTRNPYPPGSCFRAAAAYIDFGMRLHVDHNEAWRSNPETISAFFLRYPPKNGLPLTLPAINRKSPLAEMTRIHQLMPREGFDIYRSGGNAALKGNAPPGAGARSAGEGAFFEHEQTIRNAYNFALEAISESGRPIAVFGAGSLIPNEHHDPELMKEIGRKEQAFYFGVYIVTALGEQPALRREQIRQIMDEYLPIYPDLSSMHLRFLLLPHRAYRLVPVEYPPREDGYRHFPVDVRDTRRPLFGLPPKTSFSKAFEISSTPSSPDDPEPFDQHHMFKQWYQSGGLNEFLSNPFVPGNLKSKVPNSLNVDWEFASEGEAQAQSAFAPLAKSMGKETTVLSEFEVKSNTVPENFWIVMVCSVASFCRELEVHVDTDGFIGPLVDADSSVHKLGSLLANYEEVFGAQCSKAVYMQMLGLEIQRSPLTHPIRSYDACRRWLMHCSGGGLLRCTRTAPSVDHLFHSVLVEVVRLPFLMEWSAFQSKEVASLPGVPDIDAFLLFLDSIMVEKKWRTMTNILQTQYELHEALSKWSSFTRFMKSLGESLKRWLQAAVRVDADLSDAASGELFSQSISSLSTLFGGSDAMGSAGRKVPFFCQHVLSNMNELYDGWPFGRPSKAISGFGGLFGVDRLRRGKTQAEDKSMEAILDSMMRHVNSRSESELSLIGLAKNSDSVVVVKVNRRPITCLDTEHWCCVMMPFTERMVGGSRGLGDRYQVTSTHCQPVRQLRLPREIAMEAMRQFKIFVDNGKWMEMADLVIGVSGSIGQGETENDNLLGGSDVGNVEEEPGKRMSNQEAGKRRIDRVNEEDSSHDEEEDKDSDGDGDSSYEDYTICKKQKGDRE